jgi:hypothetical protein
MALHDRPTGCGEGDSTALTNVRWAAPVTAMAGTSELDLRKEKSALENRARELDLEVALRVDVEKRGLEEAIRRSFAEQQDLKLKERRIHQ